MKATIRSTDRIVHVNDVPARVWVGVTESGVPFEALITRVAVAKDLGADALAQFEAELQECDAPRAETFDGPWPLRLVL